MGRTGDDLALVVDEELPGPLGLLARVVALQQLECAEALPASASARGRYHVKGTCSCTRLALRCACSPLSTLRATPRSRMRQGGGARLATTAASCGVRWL
eukprot:scaffold3725_cov376-Prasinococcus_capsulatus_cf.AAC.6